MAGSTCILTMGMIGGFDGALSGLNDRVRVKATSSRSTSAAWARGDDEGGTKAALLLTALVTWGAGSRGPERSQEASPPGIAFFPGGDFPAPLACATDQSHHS